MKKSNRSKVVVPALLLFGLSFVFLSVSSRYHLFAAQNTNVSAVLCDTSGPDLNIINPQSDSVVDTPTVNLDVSTTRTSQVDIYVNNNYSQTIAVQPDGPINSQVSLEKGLNNIRIAASFSCNSTTKDYNVVVTYEPSTVPSNGGSIDTSVPDKNSPLPTISNVHVDSEKPENSSIPVRIAKNLRLIQPANAEVTTPIAYAANTVASWVSLAGFVAGAAVIALPSIITVKLAGLLAASHAADLSVLTQRSIRVAGLVIASLCWFVLIR